MQLMMFYLNVRVTVVPSVHRSSAVQQRSQLSIMFLHQCFFGGSVTAVHP